MRCRLCKKAKGKMYFSPIYRNVCWFCYDKLLKERIQKYKVERRSKTRVNKENVDIVTSN